MILRNKSILVVGDEYVANKFDFNLLKVHEKPGKFSIRAEKVADMEATIRLTDNFLGSDPYVHLVLLFPFLWEFIDLDSEENGLVKYLTIKEKVKYSLKEMINLIRITTERWKAKYPNLLICWCTPYPPDFLTFNEIVLGSYTERKLSKYEVSRAETMTKEFYSRSKDLVSVWSREIPDILLLDLNECFFLKDKYLEKSFLRSTFSDVYFPKFCTADGLVPVQKIIFQFFLIFHDKIYPQLINLDRDGREWNQYDSYDSKDSHALRSSENYFSNGIHAKTPVVIDYQHSKSQIDSIDASSQNINILHQDLQEGPHPSFQLMPQDHGNVSFQYHPVDKGQLSYNHKTVQPSNYPERFSQTNTHLGPQEYNKPKDTSTIVVPPVALENIPKGIFDSLKIALNYLNSAKKDSKFPVQERKPSPYKDNLSLFFNPVLWKDLFLKGDKYEALNCLHFCVDAVIASSAKKGLKVIMITSSEDLINLAEQSLQKHIEKNEIGLNDNIPYGTAIILVDKPSNLRLRLAQNKFRNFLDPMALLVFGDDLLVHKSPANIEFAYLVKSIINDRKEVLNKVIISESGSTEAEIVAQNAFKATFHVPRRDERPLRKEDEESTSTKEKQGINAFLVEMMEEDKLNQSVPTTVNPSPRQSDNDFDKAKGPSKLELIFKKAHVSLSAEEKKEFDNHDKKFVAFLSSFGRSVENEFLKEGEKAVTEHESEYKAYQEVPDLHPDYEERYESFIQLFEHLNGKDYNPQDMQTTWKHFWDRLIKNLQEIEWKKKKKELQLAFIEKYQSKREQITSDKQKEEDKKIANNEREKRKREEIRNKEEERKMEENRKREEEKKKEEARRKDEDMRKKEEARKKEEIRRKEEEEKKKKDAARKKEEERIKKEEEEKRREKAEKKRKEEEEIRREKAEKKRKEEEENKKRESAEKKKREEARNKKEEEWRRDEASKKREDIRRRNKEESRSSNKRSSSFSHEDQYSKKSRSESDTASLKAIDAKSQMKKPKEDTALGQSSISLMEQLKKVYYGNSFKNPQDESNPAKFRNIVHDLASPLPVTRVLTKEGPRKVDPKSKIVFNLSVPKSSEPKPIPFSLPDCLRYLKLISGKIGMMGHALRTVVDQAQNLLPNTYEAFKVFTDKDSELLVNISINKIKSLLATCSEVEAKVYQKTISYSHTLLEESKKAMENAPPPAAPKVEESSSLIDTEAVAKATVGFNTEATYKFIRTTFLYKGLQEPSQEQLDQMFKDVSAIHFKLAMNK